MVDLNRTYTAKHLGKIGNRKVAGICLHDTAGSGTVNDVKYLANPSDGRTVSVDFCVDRDGIVYQLNPDLNRNFCYHAGRSTEFEGHRNADCNIALIGIEIVQKANLSLNPIYTQAQVNAVADLCLYLCEKFDLGKDKITTHQKIIRDGSRSDPRQFPFLSFWTRFNTSAEHSANASHLASDVSHTVVAGDTLYGIARKYQTTVETLKALNHFNTPEAIINIGQVLKVKA